MNDSLFKRLLLLMGIIGVSACDPGNCKEIIFNGVDDPEALSELTKFLSESIDNCQSPTDTSDVKEEISATAATRTTEAAATGPGPDWNRSGDTFYKCFNNVTMNYREAKEVCEEYTGRLAAKVLRDPTAASKIAETCLKNKRPWVGYDDIAKEGEWIWSDGGTTNNETSPWKKGEPNNNGSEDCAHITKKEGAKLLLNDKECHHELTYICEV